MSVKQWFFGVALVGVSFAAVADDSFLSVDQIAAMNEFMAEEIKLETDYDAGGLRYLSMVIAADEPTKTITMALELDVDANLSISERREIGTSFGFEHSHFSCQFLTEYLPLFPATAAFTTQIKVTSEDDLTWYNGTDTCELSELTDAE